MEKDIYSYYEKNIYIPYSSHGKNILIVVCIYYYENSHSNA